MRRDEEELEDVRKCGSAEVRMEESTPALDAHPLVEVLPVKETPGRNTILLEVATSPSHVAGRDCFTRAAPGADSTTVPDTNQVLTSYLPPSSYLRPGLAEYSS